ncbi:LRR receptor-like serine/threonine-protein kinase RPK2 [Forsythia ovata]|uniref:LRR receptor-like serine/threonine-protein kinase RPK2 n=1 Tax=Forsythia ovata TaxID=205694 RepID=A0ABD1WNI4_9LAMI
MLEEVIPIELGQLRQLEVLDISRNNIGGSIPAELGNCSKLSVLVLSNLWDPLPNVFSSRDSFSMGKFEFTTDEFNFYEGTIPAEITILPSLRLVWAPRATLEGQLPGTVQSMTISSERLGKQTIYAFFAGRNNLIGSFLGSFFEKCDQVRGMMLNVSNNGLSGEFPLESSTMCKSLILLDASRN